MRSFLDRSQPLSRFRITPKALLSTLSRGALPGRIEIVRAASGCGKVPIMSVAELPIQFDREKIAEFCRARRIRKWSLFGSPHRDNESAAVLLNPRSEDTVPA